MANFRRLPFPEPKDRSRPVTYIRTRRIEYILLINLTRLSFLQVRSSSTVVPGKSNRNNLVDAAARISRCIYARRQLSAIFLDRHKSFIGTIELLHASNSRNFYCLNLRSFCSKFFPSFTTHSKEFYECNRIIHLWLLIVISSWLRNQTNCCWRVKAWKGKYDSRTGYYDEWKIATIVL